MDPIFWVIVLGVLLKEPVRDAMAAIRGQTPPSHEWRMRQADRRDAAAARRHERRSGRGRRPRGKGRAYLGALKDHAFDRALQKRYTKWEKRDPVKARAYADKIQAKIDGTYRGPVRRTIDRGRTLHERVKRTARGVAFDAVDKAVTQPGAEYTETPEERAADRAAAVNGEPLPSDTTPPDADALSPDPSAAAEPSPDGDAAAEAPSGPRDPATDPATDSAADVSPRSAPADRPALTGDDCPPGCDWCTAEATIDAQARNAADGEMAHVAYACNNHTDDAAALTQQLKNTPITNGKEPTTMTTTDMPGTGETVGLGATEAQINAWATSSSQGQASFDAWIASLENQDVGPIVTDGLKQAQEGFAQIAAGMEVAQSGIGQVRGIADQRAAIDWGDGTAEFQKNS